MLTSDVPWREATGYSIDPGLWPLASGKAGRYVLDFRIGTAGSDEDNGRIKGGFTAIVLVNADLAVNGDRVNGLPPLKPDLAGSFGTAHVHSHIATEYIEKTVYRVEMAQAATWQRPLDQGTFSLANVQPKESGVSRLFDRSLGWG